MLRRPLPRLSSDTAGRFVFEIVTITAGILIALWIDGIKEDRKDQALVRSAQEQLAREIADNRRDVAQTAPSRDQHMKALVAGLGAIEAFRNSKTPLPVLPSLGLDSPSFPRSARDAAGRTGALGLMDYPREGVYGDLRPAGSRGRGAAALSGAARRTERGVLPGDPAATHLASTPAAPTWRTPAARRWPCSGPLKATAP